MVGPFYPCWQYFAQSMSPHCISFWIFSVCPQRPLLCSLIFDMRINVWRRILSMLEASSSILLNPKTCWNPCPNKSQGGSWSSWIGADEILLNDHFDQGFAFYFGPWIFGYFGWCWRVHRNYWFNCALSSKLSPQEWPESHDHLESFWLQLNWIDLDQGKHPYKSSISFV